MGKKRLFIALDLPAAVGRKIHRICGTINEIRWTRQEQLHLTLSFLGDTDEKVIPHLIAALEQIDFKAFDLCIAGSRLFRSQIFLLDIFRSEAVISLKKQIDDVLGNIQELNYSNSNFVPHITLARLKGRFHSKRLDELMESFAPLVSDSFTVEQFALYSSQLEKSGAIHTPLKIVEASSS